MDYRINYPVSVTGAHIFDDGVTIGAQGSQNAISLTLTFDETWDGLGKTIMWFGALDHDQQLCETVLAPSMRVDEDPRVYCVPFPQEIMQESGKAAITIEGTETVEGETVVILTTEYGYFRVMPSSNDVQDIDPQDNPQTILQQVLELVEDAEGYVDDAQGYASDAEGYANSAEGYASTAQGYVSDAQGYASDAQGYASAASGSATEASGYASSASGYADDASGYATAASGSASEASGYATDASGYASDAQGYAEDAQGYAQTAQAAAATCESMVAMTDADLDAICT